MRRYPYLGCSDNVINNGEISDYEIKKEINHGGLAVKRIAWKEK